MEIFTVDMALETTQCSECGIIYAIPKDRLDRERNHKGKGWYCPNGHSQVFKETEAMRLKHKLDQMEADRDWYRNSREKVIEQRDGALRSLSATKGHLTRTKKRIANGVCPCCHRHFENLERHMKGKHPEYDK